MSTHSAQISVFGFINTLATNGWNFLKKIGQYTLNFADGDGVGLVNQHLYIKNLALAASSSETKHVNDGTQVGPDGVVLTMTKLRILVLANIGTTDLTLTTTFGILSDVTKTISIPAGGMAMFATPTAAGYTGSGTGDFVVTNTSGSTAAAYELYVSGS